MLRLARVFGSAQAALEAGPEDLVRRARLSWRHAQELAALGRLRGRLAEQIAAWSRDGISLVAMGEEAYPAALLDLRSPPPLLYLRGSLRPGDARAVAVVGTRQPSADGATRAQQIALALAARGFTIVSGLARGIDTAAHWGALTHPRGRTVAVLGCGLQRIYPPENAHLAEAVARRGALLAEVAPHATVNRRCLLARDRVQAALARAVVVVQAHAECGSIVTARHARACGRLLLGVPWCEPPFSHGWQRLRQLGARPIEPEADLDDLAELIEAYRPRARQHVLPS